MNERPCFVVDEGQRRKMELGDTIGKRYRIICKLGQGKFGTVHKAHSVTNYQVVAIKTESIDSPVRLLKNEAAVLKYLYDQGSRYIPILYWYGLHLDTTCLAISYYTISLYDYLHAAPLDSDKKAKIMTAMIDIVESIHTHFVIHRDLKPHNFMIKDGELYLIDFGLATFYIDSEGEHSHELISENLVGTPKYVSYYVHCGVSAGRRDDMISLGYIYLWMINGELSWETHRLPTPESSHDPMHIMHPHNVYRTEKKSWPILEEDLIDGPIHRYLDYCYRLRYEGSLLYGELKKLFLQTI